MFRYGDPFRGSAKTMLWMSNVTPQTVRASHFSTRCPIMAVFELPSGMPVRTCRGMLGSRTITFPT